MLFIFIYKIWSLYHKILHDYVGYAILKISDYAIPSKTILLYIVEDSSY